MSLISNVLGDKIIEPVTDFVGEKIKSSKWEDQYCGIVALGAILEGPNKDRLQSVLSPAIEQLLELIDHNNNKIRYSICWLFSKLAKGHHELITTTNSFHILFQKIQKGLKENYRVSSNIASIITELAESLLAGECKTKTSILSEVFKDLLGDLLSFTLRDDINNEAEITRIRISGFAAMFSLLQYASEDCEDVCCDFMLEIYNMLKNSVEPGATFDARTQELQGFFL